MKITYLRENLEKKTFISSQERKVGNVLGACARAWLLTPNWLDLAALRYVGGLCEAIMGSGSVLDTSY